ncbi:MAG TPA: DNA polymerase IV [Gammaproteobacteria bacterium]|nr:DNA polymerase IV [Gammaproteobacteria bacterium]
MSVRSDTWPRIIVHADMDAFYAAIEQLDDPRLRGRPLLVGSDSARGVVLTASYEARSSGAGSAMPMQRARRLCPDALVVPPRFERYQEISETVMATLGDFSPLVEPLSLDEAFLDMTGSTRLFGDPASIGARIKAAVRERTGGLTVSVGISATRYVAKVASGYRKPDALTIVPAQEMREWLAPMSVANLWGAGPKTAERLRSLGFETIGQVASTEPARLERMLGTLGRRFFSLANGVDPREVVGSRRAGSVGSERTLNVDVAARADIEAHLRLAADTIAHRLRRSQRRAHGVRVKLKTTDFRLLTRQCLLGEATDVAAVLFRQAAILLGDFADSGPFRLVGLAAYELVAADDAGSQLDLLPAAGNRARRLETTIDALVGRFGAGVVQRAADLERDRGVGIAANLDFVHEHQREGED